MASDGFSKEQCRRIAATCELLTWPELTRLFGTGQSFVDQTAASGSYRRVSQINSQRHPRERFRSLAGVREAEKL